MSERHGRENSVKILFGSVVYRKAKEYLHAFFSSLERQKDCNFSVLLLNDDIDPNDLQRMLSKYSLDIDIFHIPNRSPVQLRIELLRKAKYRQADLLIIGDCDDYFSDTRVRDTIHIYRDNPDSTFYYNELTDKFGSEIMPELPEKVRDFKVIGEYNFLGLSNTALNMKKINYTFINSLEEYSDEIFDWYLFSRLLLKGMHGTKVDGCSTIYRLHENNIAGIQEFNKCNIKREIEVKSKHYNSLRKYHPYYEKKYTQYQYLENCKYLTDQTYRFWWNLLCCTERRNKL